jgi:type 1 glutamine amidotransferase
MTTGQAASGGPGFNNVDAIFFMGHRELPIDDQQKADLLKFVHDDGKGFVAAHVGLTALMSWPEFGEMLGGQFQDHPYGSVAGVVINEDPNFPATRHLPPLFNLTDEFYQVKNFSREKSRVLLRLDTSKLPPNQNLLNKNGDFPLAWAKMYGQGRVFYGSFAHDAKTWDNPDVYHLYFEALRWALKLTDADVTPRPLPVEAAPGAK